MPFLPTLTDGARMTAFFKMLGKHVVASLGRISWQTRQLLWGARFWCFVSGRFHPTSLDVLFMLLNSAADLIRLIVGGQDGFFRVYREASLVIRTPLHEPNDTVGAVLRAAGGEATRFGASIVRPEHVLLALSRQPTFRSSELLASHGLNYESLKQHFSRNPESAGVRMGFPRIHFYLRCVRNR